MGPTDCVGFGFPESVREGYTRTMPKHFGITHVACWAFRKYFSGATTTYLALGVGGVRGAERSWEGGRQEAGTVEGGRRGGVGDTTSRFGQLDL